MVVSGLAGVDGAEVVTITTMTKRTPMTLKFRRKCLHLNDRRFNVMVLMTLVKDVCT